MQVLSFQLYLFYLYLTFQEPPNVTLEEVPEALYDESVQFRATVRSFATKTCVIWKKGNEIIDIQQPKYVGSSDIGDYPVLIINYVTKEDEDVYSIEVENDFGKRKRSQKLVLGKWNANQVRKFFRWKIPQIDLSGS